MQSKNQSEPAKTRFRPRPVKRPKKTTNLVFFGPSPVFLVLGNVWTGLSLSLFFLGQKNRLDIAEKWKTTWLILENIMILQKPGKTANKINN